MTRMPSRTKFHSSTLIRSLVDLDIIDGADAGDAFAEKLGQWIHFADAIALSAVHGGALHGAMGATAAVRQTAAQVQAELARIRTLLTDSIGKSFAPGIGKTHIELPAPPLALPPDIAAAFMPYRRFYEAHQRDMDIRLQPLRTNLRLAMAQASPRLKKLAELDAAFENILRERERQLLAKVPALLRKRFAQLFKLHQSRLAESGQADHPADWMRANGWLARFCQDMRSLLLAELELRLQPAAGLIEAFKQDTQ